MAPTIGLGYGLEPRLIAAQLVTPLRKSRTAKNDRNDAEAIATISARQGNMRFVTIKQDARSVRIGHLIGIGPITADAVVATMSSGYDFKHGRQFAAWLGLVPMQHSSGEHARLGRISRRGDAYLRTLLVQGARSSLQRAKAVATERTTPEQLWIRDLDRRLPFGKVLVAIANKHARQIWAMLAHDVDYDPCASVHHSLHKATGFYPIFTDGFKKLGSL